MRHITLISTGGTIEKTYDEAAGSLENRGSIIVRMLDELRLDDTRVSIVGLMSKDSLHMTDEDRGAVVAAVREHGGDAVGASACDGIIILHGTDTLERTGEAILAAIPSPRIPVILTGAMRPFEMKRSDALQNLTEAVFAAGVLAPGVYCVAHGRALRFPGVTKDRSRMAFVQGGH